MNYANPEHTVIDMGNGRFIPVNPGNADYKGIDLNQVGAYVPPPPEPIVVSAAQALLALDDAHLLDTVTSTVASHPVKAVKIWYDKANFWESDNVYVQALAAELGLTDTQVLNLFKAALLK